MKGTDLINYMQYPSKLNNQTLAEIKEIAKEYPFFHGIHHLLLVNMRTTNDILYANTLKKSSLYITDKQTLKNQLQNTVAEEKPTIEQENIITFHSTESIIENTIPSTNLYHLESAEEKNENIPPRLKNQDLIDNFIQLNPRIKPIGENEEIINVTPTDTAENEEYFTETLAKIYIKQKHYDKAIAIFKRLNLKYPEKSIYFADQIRFLEKIINHKT